jgi:hypothetical protein
MSHLSAERLAALIDEQPTAGELAHLSGCAACSRERGAYEALSHIAKNATTLGQPLTSWGKLAPRLKHDGVIDTGRGFGRRSIVTRGWLQAAAAVLLLVSGTVIGRMSASASAGTQSADGVVDPLAIASAPAPTFRNVAEAEAFAARSQSVYQASLAFIAAHDTTGIATTTPAAIRTRLATIDRVSQIVGAALEDAPYDSVINTMYLNAQGQREASMRQLNSGAMRLTTY